MGGAVTRELGFMSGIDDIPKCYLCSDCYSCSVKLIVVQLWK